MHELFSFLRLQNDCAGLYWESYKLRKYFHTQDDNFNIYIKVPLPKV